MDNSPESPSLEQIWAQNRERLKGPFVNLTAEMVFNRASIHEFLELVDEARNNLRPANDVIAFIDQTSRFKPPASTTAFGLGWIVFQGLQDPNGIAGVQTEGIRKRQGRISLAINNIYAAAGLPDPHIFARDRGPIPYPFVTGSEKTDLIEQYADSVSQLFDYFELNFSPQDVIKYCQGRIQKIEKYLAGGINIRNRTPLSVDEITGETNRLLGFQEAIVRNQNRMALGRNTPPQLEAGTTMPIPPLTSFVLQPEQKLNL